MTGERLGWFRLASHLHIPVCELQQRISSTEFMEWMVYLEEEPNDFHRDSFYMAQIAREIRRSYSKDPGSVDLETFLLKFTPGKKKAIDPEERLKRSKAAWGAAKKAARKRK